MGEALLSRLLVQQTFLPDQIIVSEPQAQRREFLSQQYGVETTIDNQAIASSVEVLLLAIKPQVFDSVTADLHPPSRPTNPQQIVLSILAGVPLKRLEAAFPDQPVIRAMPNTPATVAQA